MEKEKLIRRDDGTKIILTACYSTDRYSREHPWSWRIRICQKRKRKFYDPHNNDDDEWRRLSSKDRIEYIRIEYLQYVTKEEVFSLFLELWEEMKPEEVDV